MDFKTSVVDAGEAFVTGWKSFLHYETKSQLVFVILKMIGLVMVSALLGLLMIMCLDAAFTRRKLNTCCKEDSSKNKKVKKITDKIADAKKALDETGDAQENESKLAAWWRGKRKERLEAKVAKLEKELVEAAEDRDGDIVTYAGAIPIYEMSRMLSALPDKVKRSDDINIINADSAVQKVLKLWGHIRTNVASNEKFRDACDGVISGFSNFYNFDDSGLKTEIKKAGMDADNSANYNYLFNSVDAFNNFAKKVEGYRKAFVESVINTDRDVRLAKLSDSATPEAKAKVKAISAERAESRVVPLGLKVFTAARNGWYASGRRLSSLVDKINCSKSKSGAPELVAASGLNADMDIADVPHQPPKVAFQVGTEPSSQNNLN